MPDSFAASTTARCTADSCSRYRPILAPFAGSHCDLTPIEIKVFHPQIQTLGQPKPRAVEQHRDQPHHTSKLIQNTRHLLLQSAWFCVDADTRARSARWVRNPATSVAPISNGWRLP